MRIVQYSFKQLTVSFLQQLLKSGMSGGQKPHRLLRLRNASTRWRSVAVMNPLHAGDAYVSRDTTTARKTACRPISVIPWWRSTQSAYSDCALSLIIRRICSDADMVTPMIFSTFSGYNATKNSHSNKQCLHNAYTMQVCYFANTKLKVTQNWEFANCLGYNL